jgi:hypothetical protein
LKKYDLYRPRSGQSPQLLQGYEKLKNFLIKIENLQNKMAEIKERKDLGGGFEDQLSCPNSALNVTGEKLGSARGWRPRRCCGRAVERILDSSGGIIDHVLL